MIIYYIVSRISAYCE